MSLFCSHNGRLVNAQTINDNNVNRFRDLSLMLRCCGEKAVLSKSRNGNYSFAHGSMRKVACPWKEMSDTHRFLVAAAHDYLENQKGFTVTPEVLVEGGDHHVCVDLLCEYGAEEERVAFIFETVPLSQRGGAEGIVKEDATLKAFGVSRVYWIYPDRWKLENTEIAAFPYSRDPEERINVLNVLKQIVSRHFSVNVDSGELDAADTNENLTEKAHFPLFKPMASGSRWSDSDTISEGPIFREYQRAVTSSVGGPIQREERLNWLLRQYGDRLGLDAVRWPTRPCSIFEGQRPLDMAQGGACAYIEVLRYLADLEALRKA